jgi:HPt (histidine-containing phosphotransfer) domain-containing protein
MPNDRIKVEIEKDLTEIIPDFLNNRRMDIDIIDKSLESGDFEAIGRVGHKMKGSGGGYGFERITEIGAGIEVFAKNKNIDKIKELSLELSDYLEAIDVVFVEN